VDQVYVAVGGTLPYDDAWVRRVVGLLHGEGVRVSALGGDPAWVDSAGPALEWHRAVVASGLFDALHLDVEVWAHPEWRIRPRELGAAYLRLLRELREVSALPLEADLAFHLHQVPTASGQHLERAAMGVLSAATVLSYRHRVSGPDSITDVAASALSSASDAGIPCRLGVETRDLGPDPVARKQTFHGLGRPALDRALAEVDRTLAGVSSYAGMSVHDYTHWRLL
jgi:hypothetical protein